MTDDSQVAEITVTKENGTEKPALKELLAEWDGRASKSLAQPPPEDAEIVLRDPEEIAAFEKQIEELEGDNSALKTEKTELTERAEQAEQMADAVEAQALRNDQHDHAELIKRLASEVGITERVAKMEIRTWFDDETMLTLADNRADNPQEFEAAIESMIVDLHDKHPQRRNDRDNASAVHAWRMAHGAHVGAGSYADENKYGDFSTMNDREFAVATEKVFEDMRSGKLRPEGRPRGGCITTSPR